MPRAPHAIAWLPLHLPPAPPDTCSDWKRAKDEARKAAAQEAKAARKAKRREDKKLQAERQKAYETWQKRAARRKYYSQRLGKVIRKPKIQALRGRPQWVDVVEPYAVKLATEKRGKRSRRTAPSAAASARSIASLATPRSTRSVRTMRSARSRSVV